MGRHSVGRGGGLHWVCEKNDGVIDRITHNRTPPTVAVRAIQRGRLSCDEAPNKPLVHRNKKPPAAFMDECVFRGKFALTKISC